MWANDAADPASASMGHISPHSRVKDANIVTGCIVVMSMIVREYKDLFLGAGGAGGTTSWR